VSNFARVGHRCRHNLAYWSGGAYLGSGLGAHSFVEERRWWNTRDFRAYVAALESGRSPVEGSETLDSQTRFFETVMLGLRRVEGLDLNEVERAWGRQRTMALIDRARIFKDEGWLEIASQTVRATGRGFLVVDALVSRLAA
jgi:oxygen-independent coproporphyrinogen-3 oxidase